MEQTIDGSAARLQRHFADRVRYRRRRDRKIAVDLLGREFDYDFMGSTPWPKRNWRNDPPHPDPNWWENKLPTTREIVWQRLRLVAYDPTGGGTVRMQVTEAAGGDWTWSTDSFWNMYRSGVVRDAL